MNKPKGGPDRGRRGGRGRGPSGKGLVWRKRLWTLISPAFGFDEDCQIRTGPKGGPKGGRGKPTSKKASKEDLDADLDSYFLKDDKTAQQVNSCLQTAVCLVFYTKMNILYAVHRAEAEQ